MIRPFTGLCMIASLGSVFYMFQMKHRSELQDQAIRQTIIDTRAAQDRAAMLRAEYARKSDDGRLLELSDRFLKLKPTQPTQFVQLADLGARLPAPRADATDIAPEDAEPEADIQLPATPPAVAAVTPAVAPVLTAAARAVPKPAPAQTSAPSQIAARADSDLAAAPARVAISQPPIQPPIQLASKPAVQPAPVQAALASPAKPQTAIRPPVGAPIMQAAASPTRAAAGNAYAGSALGGFSGGLAAPVPVGARGN